MSDTKMLKSLNHWVIFELICTVIGFGYILKTVKDFNVPFEGWPMWVTLLITVRAIILWKLWFHTPSPAATVDTTDDSVLVQSETDTPK